LIGTVHPETEYDESDVRKHRDDERDFPDPSIIIQARLRKKPGEKVCDHGVVEIREGKMRIATDADFQQVKDPNQMTSRMRI
jgi:hypothetical protein